MKLMKTAEEMQDYCMEHGTYDTSARRLLKHFQVIEDCMEEDEYAIMCFAGMNEQIYLDGINSSASIAPTTHTELACAFTNRRVIAGQGYWYPSILKVAPYERLNDVYISTCREGTNIVISTGNEEIEIHTLSEQGENIRRLLNEILPEIRRKKASVTNRAGSSGSPADEIWKFKALYDDGIITEEEFRRKKDQLLNIGDSQELQSEEIAIAVNPDDYRPAEYVVKSEKEIGLNTKPVQKESGKNTSGVYLPGCIIGGGMVFIGLIAFIYLSIS